jgi:hypothetical protein
VVTLAQHSLTLPVLVLTVIARRYFHALGKFYVFYHSATPHSV